ncbi:MAG: hypothetical protein ACKO3T_05380 [Planctomycetaceae bacterium]
MKSLAPALLALGLIQTPLGITVADEPARPAESPAAADTIPTELQQFRGMLIGRMQQRDIETGTFTVAVDYVSRVWENNRASNPRIVVGRTVTVDGVTGKWLDQLLLIKTGETVEFEAQHRGGSTLTFPGEWLRKVPAFKPADHPVPADGFRGFSGIIRGTVETKNSDHKELVIKVAQIESTDDRSRAKSAGDIVGQKIVLAGFWAKMSEPYQQLQAGDAIRAGVLHRVPQSDHFTVMEFATKIAASDLTSPAPAPKPAPRDAVENSRFPSGMQGFRGILKGQLISRDLEQGQLVFRASEVTRTWKENKASNTESCKGREFTVKRISGKWLDVLVTLKPGDRIEVEAFHNGGEHLDFVSEWLKKAD